MQIEWQRCETYEQAIHHCDGVYLHEWSGRAFYWGIVNRSVFGGTTRDIDGERRNPRYGTSYRHWIEGCLRHGGRLYVGTVIDRNGISLGEIETVLIHRFRSEMNERRKKPVRQNLQIEHVGDIPESIRHGYPDF